MGHALIALADHPTLFMMLVVFAGLAIMAGALLLWDIAGGLASLWRRRRR